MGSKGAFCAQNEERQGAKGTLAGLIMSQMRLSGAYLGGYQRGVGEVGIQGLVAQQDHFRAEIKNPRRRQGDHDAPACRDARGWNRKESAAYCRPGRRGPSGTYTYGLPDSGQVNLSSMCQRSAVGRSSARSLGNA